MVGIVIAVNYIYGTKIEWTSHLIT